MSTIEEIEALLPQTQCGRCEYAGCKPYAEAIINDGQAINRCAPGGTVTMQALAVLLERAEEPLSDSHLVISERPKQTAIIDEPICIGCTLCIRACPVDAIIGAPKMMHGVLEDVCTGCELCVPACPVDCIEMVDLPGNPKTWVIDNPDEQAAANQAKAAYEAKNLRLRKKHEKKQKLTIRTEIQAAVERAKVKRAKNAPKDPNSSL